MHTICIADSDTSSGADDRQLELTSKLSKLNLEIKLYENCILTELTCRLSPLWLSGYGTCLCSRIQRSMFASWYLGSDIYNPYLVEY